jgi:phosphoribosylamine--glycine ligase
MSSDSTINVLLLGSGGREHAIAWKLSQSPRLGTLYAAPGNPGIMKHARCRPVNPNDASAVIGLCREYDVQLVVVGPEDPLAAGIADDLAKAGISCFGPGKDAARLEADKVYAKSLMREGSIPTAEHRVFTDFALAEQHVRRRETPCVVKAAGLAKGKGVTVCRTPDEAADAVQRCLRLHEFGRAGERIVIEDLLEGTEASVLALVDGHDFYVLPPCQDHKPVAEGNTGPMTGGMGAFCPSRQIDEPTMRAVERDVFVPTLDALSRIGVRFRGCLYVGLMLTDDGPKVLEYNVRFGDPETQPLMMRWEGDLLSAFLAVAEGRLAEFVDEGGIAWSSNHAVGVVLASKGYPGAYQTGQAITGLDAADRGEAVQVFQAGTAKQDSTLVTDGGRVLCVTATGPTLPDARDRAYAAADRIAFDGVHYRRDIGATVSPVT